MESAPGRPRPLWARPHLALFILIFGVYAYFYQGGGWNPNARFDLTRALVERGTVAIDAYHENTGDKALRGGHYFCDKAPGVSWLAVPAYALVHAAGVRSLAAGAYAATLTAVALPSALGAVVLFALARRLALDARWSAALSLAYALGTLVLPYSTLLHGHAVSAALGLIAFALVWDRRAPWAAGLLLGLAVCVDYTSVILAAIVTVYAFARLSPRRAFFVVAGGVPGAAALAVYHTAAFGHPLALPYDFVMQEHRHLGLFMGLAAPDAAVVGELLVGSYRGLFYSAPWLAAGLAGFVALWRGGHRAEAAASAAVFVAFLLLNAGLVDWHGAWAMGPRYLIPTLPFLAVGAAGLVQAAPAGGPARRALAILGGAAVALSMALMLAGTAVKPEVPLDVRRPYADFLLPKLAHGNLARNTQSIDSEGGTAERQAWNLGHALGLTGLWTLAPLALFMSASGAWLFRATREEPVSSSPDNS